LSRAFFGAFRLQRQEVLDLALVAVGLLGAFAAADATRRCSPSFMTASRLVWP